MTGSYSLWIRSGARREMRKIPKGDLARIVERLRALAANSRPPGCEKLSGAEGWRVRQGDWRIVYEIDDGQREVTVVKIGHRREVYR